MNRGDANLPDINWKDETIEGNQYTRPINNTFIDAFRDVGCQQAVNFPTRVDKTLDIFVTNRPTLINKCSGLPGLSDHDVIIIDTSLVPRTRRPVKRLIYLWSKADLPGMEKELKEYTTKIQNERETSLTVPINTLWNNFKSTCTTAINNHVPSKFTSTRYSQPWCNRNIKKHSRQKRRAHQKARRTNRPADWNSKRDFF